MGTSPFWSLHKIILGRVPDPREPYNPTPLRHPNDTLSLSNQPCANQEWVSIHFYLTISTSTIKRDQIYDIFFVYHYSVGKQMYCSVYRAKR